MSILHIGAWNQINTIQEDYIMRSKNEWRSCVLKILYKGKTCYLNETYTWGPTEDMQLKCVEWQPWVLPPAWRFGKEKQKLFQSSLEYLFSCVVLDEATR